MGQQDEFCRRTLYSARVSRRHQPNVSFYTERSSDFFSPVALILLSQQVCTVFLPQRKFLRDISSLVPQIERPYFCDHFGDGRCREAFVSSFLDICFFCSSNK